MDWSVVVDVGGSEGGGGSVLDVEAVIVGDGLYGGGLNVVPVPVTVGK